MSDKDQIARTLADAHRRVEPGIMRIFRITTPSEENPAEPVKLLEVNPATPPSGIVPVAFGASASVPFASIVVEVTPDEFEQLRTGSLSLPSPWVIGDSIDELSGASLDASG